MADIVIAILMFIAFFPIIVVTGGILFYVNHGKIFFIQERPGLYGKPFRIIKFKTMTDDKKVTPVGKIVRSFSIDELLQLINVLKGEMSLVGPRPLLMKYLDRYSSEEARRHNVKPGITGWAQVNGRNAISWEEKFRLDIEYVERLSFMLDLKILGLTIIKVLKRNGINRDDNIIMEEFKGKINLES